MAVVAEFISVLRKIRDVIYPEVNALYEDSLVLKESIDVGKAEFDADFAQFNTDYDTFIIQKNQVDVAVTSAQASSNSASASATIATNKSNEIKAITTQSTTGAPGTSASASYNPTDGKFTFVIPQGSKGDKGESFTVNSSGITESRTLYDAQNTGWSFLDITTSTLYFKISNTSGNWSSGVPFGKGDTGDTGDTGVGIESFTYISTNHTSGLPAQSGGTDTYKVTLTNTLTFDYQVYNGLDADLTYVDNQIGIVQENVNTISTKLASHIQLSGVTSYHLLQGNLSVSNEIITNGFGLFTYTGNSTTPPSINLGMDITSQWGNDASETFGYLIKIKSRNVSGDWIYVDSVRGITKYTSSNTTAVEGTDTNMFTLNTVAGVTTLTLGSSIRTNVTGTTYVVEVYQTTHRITGITNQAKDYTCHYNPTMLFSINKIEGSGIAGHEIPHYLGRKLGFVTVKNLSAVTNWVSTTDSYSMNLNTTASAVSNIDTTTNDSMINFLTGVSEYNANTNQYIMYGWANSYLDETNKLIGNYEVGVYQGTGVAGNKVTTRSKPAWVMIKRLDGISHWRVLDNQRTNGTPEELYTNLSAVEVSSVVFTININGFYINTTDAEINASGGKYLYMVVYDNDSGSGKSKYPKATDSSNVQINNAIIPLAHGVDSNGSKNSIVIANETITGLTYTQGKNYLYKTDTGYGVKPYEPRYLSSELVRRFAGEQPDYYDVESNKWFNTDAGSELVTNGTFSSGVTTGWTGRSGGTGTLSVSNGTLLINASTTYYWAEQTISGLIIGKTYYIKTNVSTGTANTLYVELPNGLRFVRTTSNTAYGYFTAQDTTITIKLIQAEIGTSYWDNISVFASDIVPTTEITESRNYLNHIVHADQNGQVTYVEELPKIEYKDVIKTNEYRGKNACTAWANFDGTTTPPTIRDSYNVSAIIRTATGLYDIYLKEDMDNTLYSVIAGTSEGTAEYNAYYKNKIEILTRAPGTGGAINDSLITIHIFGGKN